MTAPVDEVMTKNPKTIAPRHARQRSQLEMLNSSKLTVTR